MLVYWRVGRPPIASKLFLFWRFAGRGKLNPFLLNKIMSEKRVATL
jgi:hypothetical protein